MTLVEASWDDSRRAAYACGIELEGESIPLGSGDRRILAHDVVTATSLPPFTTSAMDGWAVAGTGPWKVVGEVLAGQVWLEELSSGHAVRIATGSVIPVGTHGVLRREHGRLGGEGVLDGDVALGQDVRPAGEEARVGEVLVSAGMPMTPVHLGLAAAGGADQLVVVRRPVAQLLILGDELLDSGSAREGCVRDSLGPQIPAWLERMGVTTHSATRVEDTLAAHLGALAAVGDADLVVTTGGTAAGPVDHLHEAIADVGGQLVVDSVAVRPGHPMLLARLDKRRWILGLPGNPQSAVVALLSLGGPLLARLFGQKFGVLDDVELAENVSAPERETRLVLCTLHSGVVTPTAHLGSAMLRGLAASDGFAVIAPGGGAAGDLVRWLPLPR